MIGFCESWDAVNIDRHAELEEVEGDRFAIRKLYLSPEAVKWEKLSGCRDRMDYFMVYDLKPGEYIKLIDKDVGRILMSNTPMERRTNRELIQRANGDVLIAGLGIGLVLLPILENEGVKSLTVIEKYQGVADVLAESGFPLDHPKLTIIIDDIHTWDHQKKKWDVIYFDIWPSIGGDNYPEMKKLHKRFKYRLNRENPNWWMESWVRDICRKLDKGDL